LSLPTETPPPRSPVPLRRVVMTTLLVVAMAGALGWEVFRTRPVRRSLDAYNRLIFAADQGDLAAIRTLCSTHYLARHPLQLAPEGGLVGLPHYGPHKNFRAWRRGDHVLICPTNRVGPVYRFVEEADTWRFDGPIGLLQPDGRVESYEEPEEPRPPEF